MLLRGHANKIIEAALAAAMPDAAVQAALEKAEFSDGRLVLIAAGKAGWQMAKAACDRLGGRIDGGVVITKYDHSKGPIGNLSPAITAGGSTGPIAYCAGAGASLGAGFSLSMITGNNFKIKAFAELESMDLDRTQPLLNTVIVGFSTGWFW